MKSRCTPLVLLALAASTVGWLDAHATAREGNRLFGEGKYEEAASKYNEALVDQPDSAALHVNLGAAYYKQGKYDDAIKALQQEAANAGALYDLGNTKYRLAAAAEASDPKAALTNYGEALVAYRRAMGLAPDDLDVKFNYEFVSQKLAEFKKKLEEQQQQQQQDQNQEQQPQDGQEQQQDQQHDQQQGEQPPQPEQQDKGQPSPQEEQKQGQGPEEQPQPQAAGGEAAEAANADAGEMSPGEAAALLDAQRDEEVKPDEIVKRVQGAGVAEPAQDW